VKARILLLLLSTPVLFAQIRWDAVTSVAPDDPCMPVIREWQQKLLENYNDDRFGRLARPDFLRWAELPFPSLKALFPQHRFFTITWSERPVPGKEKEAVGLAAGLEETLVCDSDSKLVKLPNPGSHGEFGQLLAANKIALRTADEANLIWEAFCDFYQKHWKGRPALKVSDTVWHLGKTTNSGVHYFYEVTLGADQIVKAGELRSQPIKEQ
jgi:hypothetical protein